MNAKECIQKKIDFVNNKLNPMMTALDTGVSNVEYRVFKLVNNDEWFEEFLIVHYKGGAEDITYCSGNNEVAIAEEAIELATYKGHYGHKQRLEYVESKTDEWIKLPNFTGFEYDERSYLAWVLIYDQMIYLPTLPEDPNPENDETIVLNAPCDVGYEICLEVVDKFLKSEENVSSKPLYTAFWSWFENNIDEINHFVRCEIESRMGK